MATDAQVFSFSTQTAQPDQTGGQWTFDGGTIDAAVMTGSIITPAPLTGRKRLVLLISNIGNWPFIIRFDGAFSLTKGIAVPIGALVRFYWPHCPQTTVALTPYGLNAVYTVAYNEQ